MFLLIDNYDSFTWNIYHYVSELGTKVNVCRNDEISSGDIINKKYKGVIFSPGPGHPSSSGNMVNIIKEIYNKIPILGICLGHQAIAYAFGGKIVRMKKVMHGRTDNIKIIKKNIIFNQINTNFIATRYHSLEVQKKSLPKNIQITACTKNNTIMAIKLKNKHVYGLQFHPESIETKYGKKLFSNFIKVCNS